MSTRELPSSLASGGAPRVVYTQGAPGRDLVALHEPFDPAVEALRRLRAQLLLRWFDGSAQQKTLAVVGTDRGEGRSFIAANLAAVLSQLGKRTLLIDADLRNPVQHRIFNLDNASGLAQALASAGAGAPVSNVVSMADLSVLTAGAAAHNAPDLLARAQFAQLLRDLETRFDHILVDTPATCDSPDAQSVAACAGAALIVAREGVSRVAALRGLIASLADAHAKVVGTVLNHP